MLRVSLIGASLVLLYVWTTDASCFIAPLEKQKTLTGYRDVCVYHFNRRKLQFDIGSDFTIKCQHCVCTKDGLQCCGVGYYAGVMAPPEGCRVVPDGCDPLFIQDGIRRKKNWRYCDSSEKVFGAKKPT